jgi:glutamate-1-semialdehyde 2,1-aminomutase
MNQILPSLDLDVALAEAEAHFVAKRPKTAALHARARAVMPGGNTRTVLYSAPFPIRIERAEGATLHDIDGHAYTDFVGEYSAGLYGHSDPRIAKAVADAMSFGVNMGAQHVREVAFAEEVCRRFHLDLVRFTNSGTEANMMAIAAARCHTGRRKIMPMHGGYHGGTLYFAHGASPVNAPFDAVLAHHNDTDATAKLIDAEAGELACVIIEPMLGGGGCIPASPEFLEMLRERTKQRGIVLIFDEVMTSRLAPGGLSELYGIEPDLKTLGKYVGGGMSFGAFGGSAAIMQQFDPSRPNTLPHAGTFNNNTLTMSAGHVALTEIYTLERCRSHNAFGDALRQEINDLFMRHQAPMQVAGIGSMMTIHPLAGQVSRPEDLEQADKRLRRLLYLDLLDAGIYIAERGFIALSLVIDDQDSAKLLKGLKQFVERRKALLTP